MVEKIFCAAKSEFFRGLVFGLGSYDHGKVGKGKGYSGTGPHWPCLREILAEIDKGGVGYVRYLNSQFLGNSDFQKDFQPCRGRLGHPARRHPPRNDTHIYQEVDPQRHSRCPVYPSSKAGFRHPSQ